MATPVYDPLLDPDRLHELVRQVVEHGERVARMLMRSLAPKGRFIGQEKEKDKIVELVKLMAVHDTNLEVASGQVKGVPFGNMRRAQNSLLREEELKREFWDGASSTAKTQEIA